MSGEFTIVSLGSPRIVINRCQRLWMPKIMLERGAWVGEGGGGGGSIYKGVGEEGRDGREEERGKLERGGGG